MNTIRRLTPAQALAQAKQRHESERLRRTVAADLAKLIAALPRKPKE